MDRDPQRSAAPPALAPLARLVEELALGVAQLATDGSVVGANPAATAMLEGGSGRDLAAALVRLVARVSASAVPVGEALLPSSLGEVRVLLTAAPGQGYLALLDRDASRRLRDQAIALRGMLAAAVESRGPSEALQRALGALASVCRESHLVLWGARPDGALEVRARARGPGADLPRPALAEPGDGEALAARAVETGIPVHLPRVGRADSYGLAPHGDHGAALAIPARDHGEVVGALFAMGPRLGEGELRLLAGLADAAGALLGRARAQAALADAEARAEKARQVAVEREGLATLGHLAACVTHEIASPLACLGSNLRGTRAALQELAACAAGTPHQARAQELAGEIGEMLDDSDADLQRVGSLVQSIRGLSRSRVADQVAFDPRAAVEDAVRIFRGANQGCTLELEAPASLPEVLGSPGQFCQVVLNLLENGLDAMGGTGRMGLRLAEGPDGGVTLEVTDQGGGIPPQVAGRIYDAYFTTKPPGRGTGLGLYITRSAVERMGGRIAFSTGGAGTTFRIDLPPAP